MSILADSRRAPTNGDDYEDSYEFEYEQESYLARLEHEQKSYFAGLDEAGVDFLESGTASATELLIFDCERGIKVNIGFCENCYPDTAQTLRTFIAQHPEFSSLIQPILDYDPEFASAGDLCFERDGDKIKYCLMLMPMYKGQEGKQLTGELTLELFRKFATLTEPFGGFTTEGGDRPLNF